jgi:hypothetical protein
MITLRLAGYDQRRQVDCLNREILPAVAVAHAWSSHHGGTR